MENLQPTAVIYRTTNKDLIVEHPVVISKEVVRIEYNKTGDFCFIDLEKRFDRTQVHDMIHVLYEKGLPLEIIKLLEKKVQ